MKISSNLLYVACFNVKELFRKNSKVKLQKLKVKSFINN